MCHIEDTGSARSKASRSPTAEGIEREKCRASLIRTSVEENLTDMRSTCIIRKQISHESHSLTERYSNLQKSPISQNYGSSLYSTKHSLHIPLKPAHLIQHLWTTRGKQKPQSH